MVKLHTEYSSQCQAFMFTQHKCRYIAGNPSQTSDEEEDAEHCPRIWKHLNNGSNRLKSHSGKDHRFSSKPGTNREFIVTMNKLVNHNILLWCCFNYLSAICPETKDPKRTPSKKTVEVNGCFHWSLHTRSNWNKCMWTLTQLNQLEYFMQIFIYGSWFLRHLSIKIIFDSLIYWGEVKVAWEEILNSI